MKRAFPRAVGVMALGLSLGSLAWAATATMPPTVPFQINSADGSLGTPVDGATTKSLSLTGNTVTLNSGTVAGYVVGAVNTEDYSGAITGNTVYINGGTVGLDVYGGWATVYDPDAATSSNKVVISAGTVSGNVFGGYSVNTGDSNSVTISGGTVSGTVYGGFGPSITGNSVTISGGTVSGSVYGAGAPNALTKADNNTVTISGTPVFDPATTVLGGVGRLISCPPPGPCPFFSPSDTTNNNLNLHSAGLTVKDIVSFNALNFYLPASLSTGTPVLTVTDAASLTTGSASAETSTVTVQIDPTSPATLSDGTTYTLISAPKGTLYVPSPFTPVSGTITDATSTAFPYTVDVDTTSATADTLVLKVGTGTPLQRTTTTTPVPANGPASLALLALLLAATGWLARRGVKR